MKNLGEIFDELLKRWKAGENVKAFISNDILPDFIALLSRETFKLSQNALSLAENPDHRERLATLLASTVAFSCAGAAIGMSLAGPTGAGVGATVGAAIGLVAGCLVITLTPNPDSGGYTFCLA